MVRWRGTTFLRDTGMIHREKGIAPASQAVTPTVDDAPADVVCKAVDYAADTVIAPHRHARHQLVYAMHGLMVVMSGHGRWVVPSTRALWMPAGTEHAVRAIGALQMRSLYVRTGAIAHMPIRPSVVEVGPLLGELIRSAAQIPWDHAADSRDGRLMRLILDELQALPALPLHLPEPRDPDLRTICSALERHPEDPSTLAEWARRLGLDSKTIQRRFRREMDLTFGQWRQQVRLLRGLERLAAGEKIIDVAVALGYDSPSAFTAMFRRQFGQPPSQFFR